MTKLSLNNTQYLAMSLCYNSTLFKCKQITCLKDHQPLLTIPYCATYSDETKLLSIFEITYCKPNGHKIRAQKQIVLPRNLSQLNNYICGPLNRKGHLCRECATGFGPSVTSFGYRCIKCADAWYRVPLFLVLELTPITILYFIILVFQVSITSAPMPCFIMLSQFISILFTSNYNMRIDNVLRTKDLNFRLDMHIMVTLYAIFNLNFWHYDILPPYCVSSKLKPIHLVFLGYITAFYPILLVVLTWICVELHGRNFRPLVWLWRPFHRCFVRLRRSWDTKSDIIDVFTTFFILSYNKFIYQTELTTVTHLVSNINEAGKITEERILLVDPSIVYGGSYHLAFVIPSLFISALNILPPLLLILFPIRAFRSCLSKCNLNMSALHTFTDKVYGCYRNGLDGGRDMRSVSGLYFLLRPAVYLLTMLPRLWKGINKWFMYGALLCTISLFIAFAKPYKKCYMNFLDAALLLYFAMFSFTFSTVSHNSIAMITRILVSIPILLFLLIIIFQKIYTTFVLLYKVFRNSLKLPCTWLGSTALGAATINDENALVGSQKAAEPLIQPTSTVISYGADDN